MIFTIDNEYCQTLLELSLTNFGINYQQKRKVMEAEIELEDFMILDKWSKSNIKNDDGTLKWDRLLDAREEEVDPEAAKKEDYKEPKALIVQYTADEDFKTCPYALVVRIDKPLYITALLPLINEL